ncbi:MAG: hypothetical protein ABS49_09035 [Erythrobacter sp. SCN 62-14]|nr:MAG: hypothetical protein ABS49_09035 [Erythrobacter sp. SCN 62-14]
MIEQRPFASGGGKETAALFDSAHPFWQGAPRRCSSVAILRRALPCLDLALARSKYHIFQWLPGNLRARRN